MKSLSLLVTVALSLLLPRFALAWGDAGHITIAGEAYRQLSPEVKAQVFDILKSHPDFAKWQKGYHPNATLDLPATVFLRSATWPDEIRGSGTEFDHPFWHFIDYPLRPPNFPMLPDERPTNNVIFGIARCESILGDTNATAVHRAAALSYLVHLVGDLHQPLHCESLYTDEYTNGDRGGNDVFIKPADVGIRLHGFWDGLLGTGVNRRNQWNYGTQILTKFPRSSLPELKADTTPVAWSLESRKLAIHYGYLDGNLKGSRTADTAPPLPAGYASAAKAVAEKQAALAGDRLADEIQTYLKWSKDLPLLPDNTNVDANEAAMKIGVDSASKYYDETLTVTGKVVEVHVTANIVFMRFQQAAGAVPFSAVIFKEHTGQFGDLQKWANQDVEVNGTVTEYRNRPEIILETANQLKLSGGH